MKVAFLGNMNNYTFPVAREMRKMGVQVRFLVDSDYGLHRPETRYEPDVVQYGEFALDMSPLRIRDIVWPTLRRRKIAEVLRDYPLAVTTGYGIALGRELGKTSYVMISGSDIFELSRQSALDKSLASLSGLRNAAARMNMRRLHRKTREGFQRAIGVDSFIPGLMPEVDRELDILGVPNDMRSHLTPTDLDLASPEPLPDNAELIIVSGARQSWCKPLAPGMGPLDDKGNDVLIRGIALFASQTGLRFRARLPQKGPDFDASVTLAKELGVADRIDWFPEMDQSEFMDEVRRSDIVADQFGEGSFGMAVRDALAIGRPVIAKADVATISAATGEPLPIVYADTPESVAAGLTQLSSRSERERLAQAGRGYAERNYSARRAADAILAAFERAA